MQKKYRIAILGIGGVGGFIGGKLAAAYGHSEEIEIIFVARGSNAQAIKENGLKLITATGDMTVRPDVITDDTTTLGHLDMLICCTKAYDLERSISSLAASITPHTIILPLLNGVDNTERIQALVPQAKVLHGCIYIVSKLVEPGTVQQRGEFYSLHFGGDSALTSEMSGLLHLFGKANITAVLEENINEKVWSKFAFISPVATYTSAHHISIGKILESEEHTASIKKLMTELLALAKTLNITLPADSIDKNFAVMNKLPYETTSSMQADMANNRPAELETLTGYVVKKATEHGMQLEPYAAMYELLSARG